MLFALRYFSGVQSSSLLASTPIAGAVASSAPAGSSFVLGKTNTSLFGGAVITRGKGSDLGSFHEEGFIAGQRVRLALTDNLLIGRQVPASPGKR